MLNEDIKTQQEGHITSFVTALLYYDVLALPPLPRDILSLCFYCC